MTKKPNIILITIDSLRADHLGFMGYQKNISPNIDNLAKDCVVFNRAFAVGSSTPYSFPAILTSTYPLDYQGPQKIDKPRVLLSEVFKKAGYITAAFHANPFLSGFFGYNQGWDYFEDITLPTGKLEKKNVIRDFLREIFKNTVISFSPRLFFKIKYFKYIKKEARIGSKVKAPAINQLARDFIKSVKNEKSPFFLWLHYMDVHGPYYSKEHYYQDKPYSFKEAIAGSYINYLTDYGHKKRMRKFLEKYFQDTINLYDQGIECFDKELEKLLDFLKEEDIEQKTIICLTSDHGEELFERGGVSHFNCRLYNELLHVPLIIKIPNRGYKKIEKKVSLIDLAPTIINLAGLEIPAFFKGRDLFDLTEYPLFHQAASHINDAQIGPTELRKKLNHYNVACQINGRKYIKDNIHHSEELYNLALDFGEKNNISGREPEIISQMRGRIDEFETANPPLLSFKQ